jgi:mannosyltransferase OCH1-like enzyme
MDIKLIIIFLIVVLFIYNFKTVHKMFSITDTYIKLKNKNTTNYKIPLIIHQTWESFEDLPPEIIKIMNINQEVCPDFKFIFYSKDDRYNFIKDNFTFDVLKAYSSINPVYGAMKADFFRYCVLYKLGGIYLDIKSQIRYDLKKNINSGEECILLQGDLSVRYNTNRLFTPIKFYEQWALIFNKNHIYLKKIISQIVYNINNKILPDTPDTKQKILELSGPDAYSKAIDDCRKKYKLPPDVIYNIDDIFIYSPYDYKKILYKSKPHYSDITESLLL